MRKWKFEWREKLPPSAYEELEVWISVLLALAAGLLLYATLRAQAARAEEFPSDVGAPTLLFHDANGSYSAATPLETDLRMSVAGVVARVHVTQRFHNSGTTYLEAVYVLPLPDDAAVDRLTMKIGERVIEGVIRESGTAERIYGAARAAGQRVSLVRQASANRFTAALANIAPGEHIDVTIEYLQTARYDAGEFSVRVPLTFTPRYGAPDTPEGRNALTSPVLADAPTMASEGAPGAGRLEASVHAVLAPGMPVEWLGSRTHELSSVRQQGPAWTTTRAEASPAASTTAANGSFAHPPPAELYVLDTLQPRVPMDRDLVIAWRPQVGAAPTVAALTETIGDTTYALLMILPPDTAHISNAGPREQIFVIDSSGSMAGQSMVQAKAALADALGRLRSGDRFNIIDFDSTVSKLYRTPQDFTPAAHTAALKFVDSIVAEGGTEIAQALAVALAEPTTAGYLRQIVFITDGAVAAETNVFDEIQRMLRDARLFTVGIGAAPNSYFMRKAAQFGRGTYTHIGSVDEVREKMTALFAKLERVALSNVVVDWPNAVELYPHEIPDVYAGEPLVLVASYPAVPDGPLLATAFGRAAGTPWKQTVGGVPSELPGISTLWARRKIEHLIDGRVSGADEALIRKLVVETALEHHLVSPYTSLVSVDDSPARPAAAALERSTVASTMPAGAQLQAAFPKTATPGPLLRWLGALALIFAGSLAVATHLPRRSS